MSRRPSLRARLRRLNEFGRWVTRALRPGTRSRAGGGDGQTGGDGLPGMPDRFIRSLLHSSPDAMLAFDLKLRYRVWNPAMERITGIRAEEAVGESVLNKSPFPGESDWTGTFELALAGESRTLRDCRYHSPLTGSDGYYEGRCAPILSPSGAVIGGMLTLRDITERKLAEEELAHGAYHDALTGLPNRVSFQERIQWAMARAARHPEYRFAVLFLDLDRFKAVNDTLGHVTGDRLLVAVAARLRRCLRPGDTVARLGGDEFTILLDDIGGVSTAQRIAERIHAELGRPFPIDGQEIATGTSIGIALSSQGSASPEELLRQADTAMYRAKSSGPGRFEVFDREMHLHALSRLNLERELRQAVERGEFRLHFQPIVSLETGSIVRFEALLRWAHPQRGLLGPEEFVRLAEETGLMVPIGRWSLLAACDWLRRCLPDAQAAPDLSVSVNLSARQFAGYDLLEQVRQALEQTGIEPHRLVLEISESSVMEEPETGGAVLNRLKDLGVRLNIDDFGTGHSSLSSLSHFPVDALKIDRRFVAGLGESGQCTETARAILALAHSLGLEAIAEGIETGAQCESLRALGCGYGQGYYFSRPVPPAEIPKLLDAYSSPALSGRA